MEIPGVGPLLASALVASVADPKAFKTGRNLAAWVGLVPKQNSSGGKERLGGITKQGDRYLRQLLVIGALAVVRYAERHGTRRPWLVQLLARRATKVATVALGPVDIVDSRLGRTLIQGFLLEGGLGAGRSDGAGVGDHRGAAAA